MCSWQGSERLASSLSSLMITYRIKLSGKAAAVQTRGLYAPFESDLRSSSSDVYYHEMPGGQYTNLKFQVAALPLDPTPCNSCGAKGQMCLLYAEMPATLHVYLYDVCLT